MSHPRGFCPLSSPPGPALAVSRDGALTALRFFETERAAARWREQHLADAVEDPRATPLVALREQLTEYFAGRRRHFALPLAPQGTEFQRSVWSALQQIDYGTTCSYAELAAAIDRPDAIRAVGRANGQNPIGVVIPCHRVIGADGSLTGYGGGLEMKRFLLELEGSLLRSPRLFD